MTNRKKHSCCIIECKKIKLKKIIEYLKSEYSQGKRKFIIFFPYEGEKHFIVYPDGKDGKTLDGHL